MAAVAVIAVVLVLTLTNKAGVEGTIPASVGISATNLGSDQSYSTYDVFGDGLLISKPDRLTAQSSPDDGISTAALIGMWQGIRSSVNTEYGFADDGWFYKNVMITHAHLNSTYNSGYWSGDYYYYGYWTYNTTYTYTYLDTLIGEYRVRGGVIEFNHIVAINRTTFEDDWYYANTRSVSLEQLQMNATSANMRDDFHVEFEFIDPSRIRFRDETEDIDLFWNLRDVSHNVATPRHEIPPVAWPVRALSPDMPMFPTSGRYREASLSYSGNDPSITPEFMTVTVVIDKTNALSEIDAYGRILRNAGWWVEDYELDTEDTYLSYEARKGMFKLYISNGRGSGTSTDTIVIESTKYREGVWPKAWTDASLVAPDNSIIVGTLDIETGVDINVYETIIFDKVDDAGVNAYTNKLVQAGFKKPQYSYDDWDYMKYVRLGGDLYLARVRMSRRMDDLTSFLFDLTYVEDGIWPASWAAAGLFPPDGYDTIAGAIDKSYWDERMAEYSSDYVSVKFLDLSDSGIDAYLNKLRSSGFTLIEDDWWDEVRLYAYLRIEGRIIRAEISVMENEDIAEIRYVFNCYEDGIWPAIWTEGGLPAPDSYDTIVGAIDMEEWNEDIAYYESNSQYIKFLGMSESDADRYFAKLKSAGIMEIEDYWGDKTLVGYLRIDGKLFRVQIERRENNELTEFYYRFNYYEDGVWPSAWTSSGIPAPSGRAIVGAIDIDEFYEDINSWGSHTAYIRILGADLSNYAATLRSNGFTEPEYSSFWGGSDTWELEKRVQINGQWFDVTVEQRENDEIPEIRIAFRTT